MEVVEKMNNHFIWFKTRNLCFSVDSSLYQDKKKNEGIYFEFNELAWFYGSGVTVRADFFFLERWKNCW